MAGLVSDIMADNHFVNADSEDKIASGPQTALIAQPLDLLIQLEILPLIMLTA
jgi:hypothetical protein